LLSPPHAAATSPADTRSAVGTTTDASSFASPHRRRCERRRDRRHCREQLQKWHPPMPASRAKANSAVSHSFVSDNDLQHSSQRNSGIRSAKALPVLEKGQAAAQLDWVERTP
jgi:hypothetical protein